MNTEAERLARVRLSVALEPGTPATASLLAATSAEHTVEMYDAIGEVKERLDRVNPKRVLEDAESRNIRFLIPGDDQWPEQLNDLEYLKRGDSGGVPFGLWTWGHVGLRDAVQNSVAIVGSRAATTYGTDVAQELASELARDRAVISGGASGIDAAAHRGALVTAGKTVCVLACGADRAYPGAHGHLIDTIVNKGGLVVSEVPPGATPTRTRFLARNRIIAALSAGTVVVEAAVRSGAMNTAGWAQELGRPLMGVPGPVTSATSEGVHQLIRTGAATLVTRAEEVKEVLA